jgi:lysophospholipase L1-like esterase
MLRRVRLGALTLLGFTSLIDVIGCSSNADTPGDGSGAAGGQLGSSGGTPVIPGGGGTVTTAGTGGSGATVVGSGGSGNTGNTPNQGGTGNVAVGGSGNLPGGGGMMIGAGGGSAGAAQTGGAAGMGAGGGSAGANMGGAGGMMTTQKPPCISNPATDVLIMGDSYVTGAASPALQPALAALLPTASQFKNVAVAGTSMATGGILGLIPTQFSGMPKLVIMDGGGNDILICDAIKFPGCGTMCNTTGSSKLQICKDIVSQATATAKTLFDKMSAAGVKDVVYFFYPHPPVNNGGMKEIDDYSEPPARAQCEAYTTTSGGKTNCYWVTTVKPFADAGGDINPANFAADGIHPSQAGQNIIAKEINNVLKAHCLGQPSSSGCCM